MGCGLGAEFLFFPSFLPPVNEHLLYAPKLGECRHEKDNQGP